MTPFLIHFLFDLSAWTLSFFTFRFFRHRHFDRWAQTHTILQRPNYWLSLGLGALVGAYYWGTINTTLSFLDERLFLIRPSHSVAGALFGAVLGVEAWKIRHRVFESTGFRFVPSLWIGISWGRLGCFFSGLTDFTYGTPSTLPWAVDMGDGISRHPVALYESMACLVLFLISWTWIRRRPENFQRYGFYFFTGAYATQRFFWEFLKPYKTLIDGLNLFHILCLILIIYSIVMADVTRRRSCKIPGR